VFRYALGLFPGYTASKGVLYGWGALFPGSPTLETRPLLGPNSLRRVAPGQRMSATLALTLGIADSGNGEPWER